MLKVKQVAELAGISIRTLHHYDEIGLLEPSKTESGYRLYSSADLDNLQQILFFRELDFPLKEIKKIMNDTSFDSEQALRRHRKMLVEKSVQINKMIKTIDKTLKYRKGEINMSNKEKFTGFDFSKDNSYEKEARERWGDKVVNESNKNIKGREKQIADEMNEIYHELAKIRHLSPDSSEAQTAINKWYNFLNKIGDYSLEAFEGLGQIYVADERFTKNIDKFGDGLAKFMCDAMKVYARKNK
mgnify:CR=1 FL=1